MQCVINSDKLIDLFFKLSTYLYMFQLFYQSLFCQLTVDLHDTLYDNQYGWVQSNDLLFIVYFFRMVLFLLPFLSFLPLFLYSVINLSDFFQHTWLYTLKTPIHSTNNTMTGPPHTRFSTMWWGVQSDYDRYCPLREFPIKHLHLFSVPLF